MSETGPRESDRAAEPMRRGLLEVALRGLMASLVRLAVGFYFRRIECFHLERVPRQGPALLASNHPNSVSDAFIIGSSAGRLVHFVATVQLFRLWPLAWVLRHCGIIPVNRAKDDPRGMRSVRETFEACFSVLENGGAIGIFPEGITYDDSQLKEVKSGTARMGLELEERHAGRLGLVIVPMGLTYSAKERYRSDVLVHAGEPIRVADYLAETPAQRREQIRVLSAELERRLKALILTLPDLETARLVEAVRRLYLDEPRRANAAAQTPTPPGAESLLRLQSIAETIEAIRREEPERCARFVRRLDAYEKKLGRLKLSDEMLRELSQDNGVVRHLWEITLGILLFPVAVYGWVHRLIPVSLIEMATRRFTNPATRKAQASSTAIVGGILLFTLFYGLCTLAVARLAGWSVAIWYGLSLPPSGLIAHYYWQHGLRFARSIRSTVLMARMPFTARRLVAMRKRLQAEIEDARREFRARGAASPAGVVN